MKFIGLLMIITSGIIFGLNKYKETEKRVRFLEHYENLLKEINIGISYAFDDIYMIFAESENPVAKKITENNKSYEVLDKVWKETAEYFFNNNEDVHFIGRFIDEFSKTDTESSKVITDNYINKIHTKYMSAKENFEKKGKIYIIYSLFISFAVAMLLI
ncbi:MAG: hypothetical protein E7564_02675 [Ruminococcaceae bacterium]|nr:hypothetical protein [Oscillospiraceae bacterium]